MTRLVKFVGRLFAGRYEIPSSIAETPCAASSRIDLELSDRDEMRARARNDYAHRNFY
ncbi:MAG: hypothetical protein LWW93_10780 [Hyphomicrobiales bacterium]|nr:hypothetical protein [Hyphomicrobiales bacterium]